MNLMPSHCLIATSTQNGPGEWGTPVPKQFCIGTAITKLGNLMEDRNQCIENTF